jgi:KaiC/GvpD/RAD55 family RecA-like ATPase
MVDSLKLASDALSRGEDDEAFAAMEKGTAVPGAGPQPVRLAVPLSRMRPAEKFPTGLCALDRVIGGLGRKELGLVMATTGMGKSTLAVNLAHGALKNNYKVLHFDTENGEEIVRARYYSRFTGIPFESIYKQTLTTPDRDRLDAWIERNDERLWKTIRLVFLGNNESRLGDVEGVIRTVKAGGFLPAVVLLDSPDHLLMGQHRDRWAGFIELYNQLDRTTKRHDIGLWATSQAALEFENRIATNNAATDSKHKPKVASVVITINPAFDTDGKPKPNGDRNIFVPKNRTGEARQMVPVQTDLKRAMFRADPPEFRDEEEAE